MRYTACASPRRKPRNSTRCEPAAPREARSVALPARSARSALSMPTRSVTSSRSCQRMVVTSNPPRSLRVSTISLPLVAAISNRRCESAYKRTCTAQASRVSPGINTERSCASGLPTPSGSKAVALFMSDPSAAKLLVLGDLGAKVAQLRLDDARVLRAHADQQLLPGRAVFQARVGVLPEHARLHQLDRRRHLGRLQQMIDHLDQPVVEVLARVAEILVRLLE